MVKNPADSSGRKRAADPGWRGRLAELRVTVRMIREAHPRAFLLMALTTAGVIAVVMLVSELTGLPILLSLAGPIAWVPLQIMFNLFAESARSAQMQGKPGDGGALGGGAREDGPGPK